MTHSVPDPSHARLWAAVGERRPLVHCLTNAVTVGRVADALAAFGALPVMASALEEAADMVRHAQALVLNLGTPSPDRWAAALSAGARARELGVPIVLDPVGCGATPWRTDQCRRLVAHVHPDIVRGNAPELAALAGLPAPPGVLLRGVTARFTSAERAVSEIIAGSSEEYLRFACAVSAALGHCTVLAVGPVQALSDGHRTTHCVGQAAPLEGLVGTGDVLTALIAACRAVEPDSFQAAQAALTLFASAADEAGASSRVAPGMFWPHFMDALAYLGATATDSPDRVSRGVRP